MTEAVNSNISFPSIGSASLRFDLAAQMLLEEEESLLTRINVLMSKLKTLLLGAKLLKLFQLHAKTHYATQWISTFEMVLCDQQLRDYLPKLESDDIDNICPTSAENRCIDLLMTQLKDLESVKKALKDYLPRLGMCRAFLKQLLESTLKRSVS